MEKDCKTVLQIIQKTNKTVKEGENKEERRFMFQRKSVTEDDNMEVYSGKTISKGIAIGTLYFYAKNQQRVKRYKVQDTEGELARFENAKYKAMEELKVLYDKALQEVGEVNADIFEVHAMMLEDADYNDSIQNMITSQHVNAEYAVASTGDNFAEMFSQMDDEYFRERAIDVKDISERIVSILAERNTSAQIPPVPSIVAAEDLVPSETVQMDKNNLLGFVTRQGSGNSHTAILARTMGIPAVSGIDIQKEWNGKTVIIDGETGKLLLDPDQETLEDMEGKRREKAEQKKLLLNYKGRETRTAGGKKIHLYANAGSFSDIVNVLANDAEGIGLFRSEFLYLEKDHFPTEEEQFQVYKAAAENMAGKKIIIRTLDIGADKQVSYFGLEKEENPAMGYRAIRICLEQPDIFKTQLRAIFRASVFGNVSVMYPMIISAEEVRKIKEIVREVKEELTEQSIPYRDIEQGIMIETPAAAIISDELAKEVDFFSIGTNDLSQYTLAIDRQNEKLDKFYNAHHPAILRLIQNVIKNGHEAGCWVGICGELGADMELTEQFLQMGIDELSVSPVMVLPLRKKISELA